MMKKPKSLSFFARRYHRNNPWRLNSEGLYVPHSYSEMTPDRLTWWDDFGFIHAKYRVIVWWVHPRMVYRDRIEALVLDSFDSKRPEDGLSILDKGIPIYKKVGKGKRKKLLGHQLSSLSREWEDHFKKVNQEENKLANMDLGWKIYPEYKIEWLSWALGVSLTFPMEIRSESDLFQASLLVRRLLRGDRSPLEQPPYDFAQWKAEGLTSVFQRRQPKEEEKQQND